MLLTNTMTITIVTFHNLTCTIVQVSNEYTIKTLWVEKNYSDIQVF